MASQARPRRTATFYLSDNSMPKQVEHLLRSPTVRVHPVLALDLRDRRVGLRADHAVRRPDVITALDQQLLQLATPCARKAGIISRPRRLDRGASRKTVRQDRDGQGVGFRGVVAVDGVEIRG